MLCLRAGRIILELDTLGRIAAVRDAETGRDCQPGGQRSPLLAIGADGGVEPPQAVEEDGQGLWLRFPSSGTAVRMRADVRPTHLALRLMAIDGPEPDAVFWGPYATTLGDVVGETVGVVQGGDLAIGLQALTYWTLAGLPAAYASAPAKPAGADTRQGYDACAAWPVAGGSLLQAHALRRGQGVADGGLVGTGVALFGCAASEALAAIERIEVEEALPHPVLDGTWAKRSPAATRSYLITDFSESALDEALGFAEAAGLGYLYQGDPFATWGHFRLKPEAFPAGADSLRRCVERAERRGIRLGVHTLSNFLTTTDPYVTPVPHPQLLRSGTARLAAPVDAAATELPVSDPSPFRERGWLGAAVLGDEVVRYQGVSATEPWTLSGCERGAYGTRASAHAAGAALGKLADHGYRVLFPDLRLQDEVADRLVDLCNRTGLRQISFDGLEGCAATGHPQFAENRFVQRCFAGWRNEVVNDASLLTHFNWHAHTRMNWGEPWGAAMREGMAEYRFDNQRYFERNLFPRMLGWFLVRLASPDLEATTLDDIEWVLARCAGYDAGCAVVADLATLRGNGQAGAILQAVRTWEGARAAGAFSPAQRERLRAPTGEWHLEARAGAYVLRPMAWSPPYRLVPAEMQPGQPGGADWRVSNPHAPQPLRFRLHLPRSAAGPGGAIADPAFVANGAAVTFAGEVRAGEYLVCDAAAGTVYDGNWNPLRTAAAARLPLLEHGGQTVSFSCEWVGHARTPVTVRFVTAGAEEAAGGAEAGAGPRATS